MALTNKIQYFFAAIFIGNAVGVGAQTPAPATDIFYARDPSPLRVELSLATPQREALRFSAQLDRGGKTAPLPCTSFNGFVGAEQSGSELLCVVEFDDPESSDYRKIGFFLREENGNYSVRNAGISTQNDLSLEKLLPLREVIFGHIDRPLPDQSLRALIAAPTELSPFGLAHRLEQTLRDLIGEEIFSSDVEARVKIQDFLWRLNADGTCDVGALLGKSRKIMEEAAGVPLYRVDAAGEFVWDLVGLEAKIRTALSGPRGDGV